MAITRINNNQITDAIAGNVYVGVNAAAKLQNYSITSGKIANNLTYGSDLTVTGNLTVQGNVTAIDTVDLIVEDPLILLASNQTGSPSLDIGFIGKRGTSENIAFVWKEDADQFEAVFTSSETSNTTITVTGFANLQVGNFTAASASVTGTTTLANVTVGNVVGALTVTGNVSGGNLLTGGLISSTGNVNGGNLISAALVQGVTVSASGNLVGGNANITSAVNSATVSASGNITGGNVLYGSGIVSGTGNIDGGNVISSALVQGVTVSASGNVVGGNANITSAVNSATVSASGNITGGNVLFGSGIVSGTGDITGGNILTGGEVSATGNITSGTYFVGNGAFLTGISSTAGTALTNGTTNITTSTNGNANVTIGGTSNVIVWATTGEYVTGLQSVTGNIIGGNLNTANAVSATGNINGGNLISDALIQGTTVSATGNVNGGNVNTATLTNPNGALTISTVSGNIILSPAGNIVLDNEYINGVAYPVQDADAASKIYVDNMVSSGLAYHEAVFVATTDNLATTTGGTITYTQPNGAGNGVGALITTTGSFNLIDTSNVQTIGTRILVKNEGNAVLNGVYTWANATNIVRSTDTDEYGPNSSEQLSLNDYFFVTHGNVNLGAAYVVDAPVGTITFGTSNIAFAQFSQSQVYSANTAAGLVLNGQTFSAKVDNNTTAFDVGGNIVVKDSANLTTPNIGAATGTSLSVTGEVTGTTISATGNLVGGNANITSAVNSATVSASGNIDGGNLISAALVQGVTVSASGNVNGGNVISIALVQGVTVSASGNVVGGNANITSAVNSATVSASGNITGGNILTGGLVSATGNATFGNIGTNQLSLSGNVISALNVTGNITGANLITGGNVFAPAIIANSSTYDTRVSLNSAAGIVEITSDGNSTQFGPSGTITLGGASQIQGGTFGGSGITLGASQTDLFQNRGGNVTVQVGTGGTIASTWTFAQGGNLLAPGAISATGNLIGGNIITDGQANLGNIRISGDTITGINGQVLINSAGGDVNFIVSGDTIANLLVADAGSDTVLIGTGTPTTNAALKIGTTNSMIIPVGNTSQRPSSPVTGMIRFNTTADSLEFYDSDSWTTAGTSFTVITDDQFTGNGVQTIFTLSGNSTTAASIVSINGVVQIPTTAYSISGANLTFTEAPESTDFIDVRNLTTTSTIIGLQNASGNAILQGSSTAAQFDLTGSLVPTGNATANIGSITNQFNTIFAQATSAQYADLAEMYEADQIVEPGTVVCFGGVKEVTMCVEDACRRVAGVVSTNPSYLMNSGQTGEYVVPIALQGRVPVKVTGIVRKGDMMVATSNGRARAEANPLVGAVIGKALADFDGQDGVIEVVIGRV